MTRVADLGVSIGTLPCGPTNSISDVPGVGLGHSTVIYDDAPPPFGRGVARTGVSVVDLGDTWASPVPAGVSVLNGAGELTARSQIDEWGILETPVFLTSTMQVGRVYDAACRLLMAEQPQIGVDDVIIPAVGEYVIPDLLGSSEVLMIGRTLWDEFSTARNWPGAAAVATVLLILLLIPIAAYQRSQLYAQEAGR